MSQAPHNESKIPPRQDLRDLKEFRKFLGAAGEGYNDAQLKQLCQDMFVMAELLLDLYLIKKKGEARKEKDWSRFDRVRSKG